MSLSYEDLQAIRKIVEETVNPLRGDIEALNNNVKGIYAMIFELKGKSLPDRQFQKLSLEENC